MDDILDVLEETDTGLLITVDEINPAIKEMETLVTTFQHFLGENRKVALALAGLPYCIDSLRNGNSTSFLRRASHRVLSNISDADIEEALVIAMSEGGKTFEKDALQAAVRAIGGFAYMFQLVGYRA